MRLNSVPTALALCIVAASLQSQVTLKDPKTTTLPPAYLQLNRALKADLLPAMKTQGQFYLTGFVRKDRSIVLRWANDQGEMPTEGVRVFRQRLGDSAWKEITKKPIGFLQGKAAEKRLATMAKKNREGWESILAYPFGNIQHDTVTRLRQMEVPSSAVRDADDLTPEKSLKQFRDLRSAGKLNRTDLQMLHMRADMDEAMAEVLGLTCTDEPGRGKWRYKVEIGLLEGGSVAVVCPKTFDPSEPTPIPQPASLTASSGNGEVLLNWDQPNSDAISGFNVYRSEKENGPWTRLNTDPVKHVELELEDPEVTVRRSLSVQQGMERMLKPLPAAARTPQKISEAYQKAAEGSQQTATLPNLSPALSKSIKASVTAGRLRPGGIQAPKSLFTDSRRTAGNTLQNEKTYYYKVTSLDLLGGEQPMDTAPVAPGTPKDLEAPQVPGRPCLKAEATARNELRTAQATRMKEPRMVALDRSASAMAAKSQASGPVLFQTTALQTPTVQAKATKAPQANLSRREISHKRLSVLASTMPVAALRKLGESAVIHSNPDGSVPPAQLVWAASPDADLQNYQVHRATGDGAFVKVAETTVPEWTDTGLSIGQAYRYAIAAVDKLGNVSALSPSGKVEVSDSSLPGRLAVSTLHGQASATAPTITPNRRFIRPTNLTMGHGTLKLATSKLTLSKSETPTLAAFQAPKLSAAPRVKASSSLVSSNKLSLSKEVTATPTFQVSDSAISAAMPPTFRVVPRTFNPMLASLTASKEVYVVLEWSKPIQGATMEYEIQQAPQRMEMVSTKRPTVAFQHSFKAFLPMQSSTPLKATALTPTKTLSLAADSGPAPKVGTITSTPALHAAAAQRLVATQGGGLRLSEAAKDHMVTLLPKEGPGTFSKVNETPISQERYVLTFPAEVAQYGGTSFYYRIQAFTREFGRRIAGPVSDPIEVRVPDIVPPPAPVIGSVDLKESGAGVDLDTLLTWSQAQVKDLAGVVVDRQPMNYKLVGGEAKADTPIGPAVRLTSSPLKELSFRDKKVPGGFQRYTLRSLDTTGNLSEPLGSLDILVPGEPIPGAPGHLTLSGNQLVWEAATQTAGYTVWRSFTGKEGDYVCISGILGSTVTSFELPAEGKLHLRVVARSASGMNTTPSAPLVRTP